MCSFTEYFYEFCRIQRVNILTDKQHLLRILPSFAIASQLITKALVEIKERAISKFQT